MVQPESDPILGEPFQVKVKTNRHPSTDDELYNIDIHIPDGFDLDESTLPHAGLFSNFDAQSRILSIQFQEVKMNLFLCIVHPNFIYFLRFFRRLSNPRSKLLFYLKDHALNFPCFTLPICLLMFPHIQLMVTQFY